MLCKVLLQMLDMAAMGAALTPGIDATHNQTTDTALGRLHGLAFVTVPAHISAQRSTTFTAIGVHNCRVLI